MNKISEILKQLAEYPRDRGLRDLAENLGVDYQLAEVIALGFSRPSRIQQEARGITTVSGQVEDVFCKIIQVGLLGNEEEYTDVLLALFSAGMAAELMLQQIKEEQAEQARDRRQ